MTLGRALLDFPLPEGLTVVDHTIKNTDVATCSVPYILPAAPQTAFDNVGISQTKLAVLRVSLPE